MSARLKPRVSLGAAKAALTLSAEEFRRAFPGALGPHDSFTVEPMQQLLVRNVRAALYILLGAVACVLLIACANVANLLLARATGRSREIALRAALGASRGRIIRQLLTESVLLSAMGGVGGLAIGAVGIRALLAVNPGNIPRIGEDGSRHAGAAMASVCPPGRTPRILFLLGIHLTQPTPRCSVVGHGGLSPHDRGI